MHACGRMFGTIALRRILMLGLGFSKNRSECFGCSSVKYVVRNMMPKQGKMLKKLIGGSSRKKTHEMSPQWMERPAIGKLDFVKPKETKSPRRIAVLNSVLMEAITDVMASGEFNQELLGLGIEISKVKVSADYSIVNVYWVCSSEVDSNTTEKLLKDIAGPIRSHLCKTYVLGNVPYVSFVKDKYQENVNEVTQLLARADFGPDFTPHDHTHGQQSKFIMSQSVPAFPECDESRIENNDSEADDTSISKTEALNQLTCVADPSNINTHMKTDILGLKHVDIMQSVVQSMRKSRAEHRSLPIEEQPSCEPLQGAQSSAILPTHGPALTMSSRQYLENRNREKHMSRKQELIDLKNAQFLEQSEKGMNLGDPGEAEANSYEDDYFDEEQLIEFNPERSSEPPF